LTAVFFIEFFNFFGWIVLSVFGDFVMVIALDSHLRWMCDAEGLGVIAEMAQ
jgi:hypothetical protein